MNSLALLRVKVNLHYLSSPSPGRVTVYLGRSTTPSEAQDGRLRLRAGTLLPKFSGFIPRIQDTGVPQDAREPPDGTYKIK